MQYEPVHINRQLTNMEIETTDDLCNQIADWIGVYGCCKAEEVQNGIDGAECTNENPLCCRVGFMGVLKERMINAVENDKKLYLIGLVNPHNQINEL